MLNGIFGIFGLGCGLYCLYAYFMMKTKKEINTTILLPKDARFKKCKDVDAYCREMSPPLLTLGIIVTAYGGLDLYNTYMGGIGILFLIMFALVWVALIWFFVAVRKCNKKYVGV